MCVYRCAGLYICVCGRVIDGCVCGCPDVCTRVRVYVYNMYIYESEQGASKEREPAGGDSEEKTERESRLIRETRMSKGRNCQPGCETDNKLSSSGG